MFLSYLCLCSDSARANLQSWRETVCRPRAVLWRLLFRRSLCGHLQIVYVFPERVPGARVLRRGVLRCLRAAGVPRLRSHTRVPATLISLTLSAPRLCSLNKLRLHKYAHYFQTTRLKHGLS